MADDKKKRKPAEQPQQEEPNEAAPDNTILDNDYRKYRQTAKEYKRTKEAQENLENNIKQYAQEGQQAQENLEINAADCDFDLDTGALLFKGETQPQLDPDSPQFDPGFYSAVAAAANDNLKEATERLKAEVEKNASAVMNSKEMQQLLETVSEVVAPAIESVKKAFSTISDIVASDTVKNIGETMRYIVEHSEELKKNLEEWERLEPYIEEELKKPEYNGRSIDDLLANEYKDENGNIKADSLLEKAVAAARAAMLAQQLPVVTISGKIDNVDYPLDKVNANVWRLLQEADSTGQMTFAAERHGSKKQADIIYSLDFEALEQETGVTITKKLTAFDKRVYIAAGALYNNGVEVTTAAQIYKAMGNTSKPNNNDIDKINESLTKMQAAHVYLNNISEHQLYSKYDKFVYDASLLPMERISAVVNGQAVESAIHLFREPPLISFARERKQITTISRRLLESPLSKTDANLTIDDYLLERISHIKNKKGKISNKLLYATIYEKCHINTAKQRSRAKEKIATYLTHYKKEKFIKDFKEEADGITIIY